MAIGARIRIAFEPGEGSWPLPVAKLLGETLTYFVPADGSSVDMVDPDGLWRRVVDRAQALAESSDRPEAKQTAQIIAALPPAERDKLASADIRALVVPANGAIPNGADGEFMAIGVWGQYVYVNPAADVIIAKTSVDPDFDTHDMETLAVFRAVAAALR